MYIVRNCQPKKTIVDWDKAEVDNGFLRDDNIQCYHITLNVINYYSWQTLNEEYFDGEPYVNDFCTVNILNL